MSKSKNKANLNNANQTKSLEDRIDEIRSLTEENLRYTKSMRESGGGKAELESQKELRKLLGENLKISKQLYQMTKKINRWILWRRIWGVVKILVIIVPIVLGLIYLPPLVRKSMKPFQDTYDQLSNFGQASGQAQGLIDQFTGQLK